ncbi:M50 family metallopeptidase [Anabaena subtropica]|uniref:M50 family metallopeptidase n=1 Tax=Anabaena subtropica FACHB-260 TaxID=2692884 RepID=A0ABR8CTL0_9NOST|nr:M50 family metallopeptidase [Anabaena subtropica]MBD2346540.1 M50 family metallopeptidase [Anabaena subtropica FACHB-260]
MSQPGKEFETLLHQEAPAEVERMGLTWLVGAAIATAVLWQFPGGDYILYPFTILATWFHEMGHGLMALLLGGQFLKLQIFGNGSGVATYAISTSLGPIGPGLVAAAGPMGPPLAGAALILASRSFIAASLSLKILGSFLLISTLIWVRSAFGLVAIPLLGLIILGISLKAPRWMQGFAIQFLGVQACISTYHQLNYLFSYSAGPLGLSDTAQMQRYLLLPYWFWGGLMAIASLIILIQSLRVAYRSV